MESRPILPPAPPARHRALTNAAVVVTSGGRAARRPSYIAGMTALSGPALGISAPVAARSADEDTLASERWTTHRIAWHVAFWAFHVVNELLISVVEGRPPLRVFAVNLPMYFTLGAAAYANILVLLPRLWRAGRRLGYAAALLLTCLLAATRYAGWQLGALAWSETLLRLTSRWSFTCFLYAGSLTALDLAVRHAREARRRAERDRAHAEQTLAQLRAQLNPHFLFNTPNSLYALAVAKSPALPGLILEHAALLRDAMEQTRVAAVPLAREVEFVAGYMELERLRLDAGAEVRFEVHGVIGDQQLPPMLFAPLVENCFKHLAVGLDGLACVEGSLTVREGAVHLALRNTHDPGREAPLSTGIGLANTRERLALLFPGRHTLEARAEGRWFLVDLRITP